ncbi:ABC transporter substrate-binding protein [Wenxinia saemankumensis]|uniref:Peptide/nickel transport system substrate-binding protein n=1 Tax=Wenxinia saemankumensis TaxID=1447782 RepID=A0A1M6B2H6_9RHOB|nr:ABC transporter substrate-binding protein [Wenxinia saemankumensis]SHI42906.1 peptide/nickel transport system substrate-binding protein [Wenxinia saemankumensis]
MLRPLSTAAIALSLMLPAGAGARPLVLAIGGEPDGGFDPIMGWGHYGSPLFYSTLLRRDAALDLVGDLATDWTLSEDGLVWRVTLRGDALFSDGTPLTAADVAFTYNTAREAGGLADLTVLAEARALDATTVELELTEPRITFVSRLATLGIVPAATYGDDHARHPVGSGPFRMVEWREGEQLVVEPNPYWHGGEIAFERVSFVFGSEEAGQALARTGIADLVAVPPAMADAAPRGMKVLHVESVDNRGLAFPMVPRAGGTTGAGAPIGNDVTADRAVRLAINQALDREALVALALNGHGRPATGPADGLPWDNPGAAIPGNDPAAAMATLEAAGWRDGDGDGLREKDGLPAAFRVLYPAGDSTRQALALGAADQLRGIGIDARPTGASWDEIGALMHSEVVVLGWGAHDPSEILYLHHGAYAGVDYYNTGHYRNPVVDAHLEAAEAAIGFEPSLAHWQAAAWDGETGFGPRGDATWAWMVNLDHSYWVSDCLDPGPLQVHPHGHGFPITHDLPSWRWTCE